MSESQPTITTFNTNDPLYQGWRTNGTRQNYLGTSTIKTVSILVQNNKVHYEVMKKRPPKTICKDVEINMTPYKPKKRIPVQDISDEEDMFEEEEMNHRISTPSRNGK
ncbi:hypothetical protein TNCV_1834391 [Trichonephila clavipes]|nr:hypothetical protein TNCV_1834391 [Trichonephila clavipes]